VHRSAIVLARQSIFVAYHFTGVQAISLIWTPSGPPATPSRTV
jgi:hypothetical protein